MLFIKSQGFQKGKQNKVKPPGFLYFKLLWSAFPFSYSVIYFTGSHGGRGWCGKEKDFGLWILKLFGCISVVFISSDLSMQWNGDTSKIALLVDNALCKVCKLSFHSPLPALTDTRIGANLTSHITIGQTMPEDYLTVLKFSFLLASAFLSLLGIFFFKLF